MSRFNAIRCLMAGLSTLAILSATVAFGATPASAASEKFRVIQHNVEKNASAVSAALTQADGQSAKFVALQEVCEEDFNGIVEPWTNGRGGTARYHERQASAPGCSSGVGEAAVWLAGGDASEKNLNLSDDGSAGDFWVTCLQGTWKSLSTRVCSTHLSAYSSAARSAQISELKQYAEPWIDGGGKRLFVLAGDFNAQPHWGVMDKMYAIAGGNGPFNEGDQLSCSSPCRDGKDTLYPNSGTPSRKVDYIFYQKKNRTSSSSGLGLSVVSSASDHRILRGWASISLP